MKRKQINCSECGNSTFNLEETTFESTKNKNQHIICSKCGFGQLRVSN